MEAASGTIWGPWVFPSPVGPSWEPRPHAFLPFLLEMSSGNESPLTLGDCSFSFL